jgi:hypothetical protein
MAAKCSYWYNGIMIILDSGNSDEDSELGNRHTRYTHRRHWELEDLTGVDERIWKMLVKYGILDGNDYEGHTEQAQAIAERLNAARAAVEGQGITAREASEKYRFSLPTIRYWNRGGWVKRVAVGRYNAILYDEGDIALGRALADIYQEHGLSPGKPIFPMRPGSGRRKEET